MDISFTATPPSDRYRWITDTVAPRPIALVTSVDAQGRVNAAPFSSFNFMGEDPALIFIGVERYGPDSHRANGIKDTLTNILASGEFVVNMVDEPMLATAVACATDFPPDVAETVALGLKTEPSSLVVPPRLAGTPVALECRRFQVLQFSDRRSIILGEILGLHVRDDLVKADTGRLDMTAYGPVGRLGGGTYCRSFDRIVMPVRKYEAETSGRR